MTERGEFRRAFLTGSAGVVASAALAASAAAQSKLTINDPVVLREVEATFAGYDRALETNDVAALNGYFFDSPTTVRYGIRENLYGYSEIQAFRASVTAIGAPLRRERTVIVTYGNDFATVSTLTRPPQPGKVGRTTQTWVRFPQGWRIVGAHVSTIDEPPKQ